MLFSLTDDLSMVPARINQRAASAVPLSAIMYRAQPQPCRKTIYLSIALMGKPKISELTREAVSAGMNFPLWQLIEATCFIAPVGYRGKSVSTYTGVWIEMEERRRLAFQFDRRKQPWDSVSPMSSGRGVPWMP